jgi:hypothetical protein
MKVSTYCIAAMVALLSLRLPAQAIDKLPVTLMISGPQTIPAGKKIEIDAVLTNVSNDTVRIWRAVPYTLQIHDEHGKVPPIKPGVGVYGLSGADFPIEPGKTYTEPIGGLLDKYDLSTPGVYVVQLTPPLLMVADQTPMHVIQKSTLESNKITIKVVAKDSDTP